MKITFHIDPATRQTLRLLAIRQAAVIQVRLLSLRLSGLLTEGYVMTFVEDVLEEKHHGRSLDDALNQAEERLRHLRSN